MRSSTRVIVSKTAGYVPVKRYYFYANLPNANSKSGTAIGEWVAADQDLRIIESRYPSARSAIVR